MRILYRFHGWLIFARVIALFMFVWPYVRSHILCTQLVICPLSHFIHIWYLSWPWSEQLLLYIFHGWLIFARVLALFMFVWPYVCSHIFCTQLAEFLKFIGPRGQKIMRSANNFGNAGLHVRQTFLNDVFTFLAEVGNACRIVYTGTSSVNSEFVTALNTWYFISFW